MCQHVCYVQGGVMYVSACVLCARRGDVCVSMCARRDDLCVSMCDMCKEGDVCVNMCALCKEG